MFYMHNRVLSLTVKVGNGKMNMSINNIIS